MCDVTADPKNGSAVTCSEESLENTVYANVLSLIMKVRTDAYTADTMHRYTHTHTHTHHKHYRRTQSCGGVRWTGLLHGPKTDRDCV